VGLVPFMSSMFEEWPFLRARVCIEAVKSGGFFGLDPGSAYDGLGSFAFKLAVRRHVLVFIM
jgi:hypothetical protein